MTAKPASERKREERERRQQEGLKRVEVWAHPDDHAAIKRKAETLAETRRKAKS